MNTTLRDARQLNTQLEPIARQINDREQAIRAMRAKLEQDAATITAESVLMGQDLLKAKAIAPPGLWQDWLRGHCPLVEHASGYIRAAQRPQGTEGILGLLGIFRAEKKPNATGPKRWPADIEAIGRLNRLKDFISKHPMAQWNAEGREKFLEDLAELWPDKVQG